MDCIFCRIINGDIPSKQVYSDSEVVAFRDADPKAPSHVLVVPRKHIANLNAASAQDMELMGKLLQTCKEVAASEGIAKDGYRVVINVGRNGGQLVDHIHFHVLGGRQMDWPPG